MPDADQRPAAGGQPQLNPIAARRRPLAGGRIERLQRAGTHQPHGRFFAVVEIDHHRMARRVAGPKRAE